MPYVNPNAVTLVRDKSTVTVKTPFWSATHYILCGGVLSDIKFPNGYNQNILVEPLVVKIDELSDANSKNCKVVSRRTKDGWRLVVSGELSNSRGIGGGIHFSNTYDYTPYSIRREVQLTFRKGFKVDRITPASCTLSNLFTHWSAAHDPDTKQGKHQSTMGPHYSQDDGDVPKRHEMFFHDKGVPGWMSLYALGGEGFQFTPTGNLSVWDPINDSGIGNHFLEAQESGVQMQWNTTVAENPVDVPQKLKFSSYITLVNLPEYHQTPLRTLMIGNPPFPEDNLLKRWSDNGVELITIMEGASWGKVESGERNTFSVGKDRFWRVGTYPLYSDKRDMSDLDRMIKSAHRFGMKVIPYTCPTELHPEASVFSKYARKWRTATVPDGGVIYHSSKKSGGGCYGAILCPDSVGWRNYYFSQVNKLLKNHDFDGIYVDNVHKLRCFNTMHGSSYHGGLDGLVSVLRKIRVQLGNEKLMVFHNGNNTFKAVFNNIGNMAVTLEGIQWDDLRMDVDSVARVLRAFPACGVSMVPSITWYHVDPPLDPQTGLRDGIIKGLLLGSIPYTYVMWELAYGYKDHVSAVDDSRGLYTAFNMLKNFDLHGMHFDDCLSNVVKTNEPGVKGARYVSDNRQVVLLGNISGDAVNDIKWECDGYTGVINRLEADAYKFIEC